MYLQSYRLKVRRNVTHDKATQPAAASWRAWLIPLALLFVASAHGAEAEGDAYGAKLDLSANVSVLGSVTATLAKTPFVSGSGGMDYGPFNETVLGVQVGLLGTTVLQSGTLNAATAYDAAVPLASSTGSVEDLDINLQVTPLLPLLGVTADEVIADAAIVGVCGDLRGVGGATLVNAEVRALSGEVIALPLQPAANVSVDILSLLGVAGVQLILNEQIESGDAFNRSLEVNALRLSVEASVLLASLSGEVIIGHASASRSCAAGDGPDLQTQKSANPNPVTVGEAMVFTLTVTNVGNQPAVGVQVADVLDPSFNLLGFVASDDGSCDTSGQTVSCAWPVVAAGQTRSATLNVLPTEEGTFSNTASASFDGPDVNPGDDDSSIDVVVEPEIGQAMANLAIAKQAAPDPAIVGQPLTYVLTVSNAGPDGAPATATDSLPGGVVLDSLSASDGGNCSGSSTISCSWPSVASGSAVTATITVTPQSPGVLLNSAAVVADEGAVDPDPSDNTIEIETPVITQASADFAIAKSAAPDPATAGQPLIYTVTLSNAGPDDAGATMIDTLPDGLSAIAVSASDGGSCSGSQQIQCDWSLVANGSSVSAQITVLPQASGTLVNIATVAVAEGTTDPQTEDNAVMISTEVEAVGAPMADLSMSKTASPDPVSAGSLLTYLLGVSNAGPDAAGASLIDQLPQGLTAQSLVVTGGGLCSGDNLISCSWDSIAAGASVSVQITVRPQVAGGLLNTASTSTTGNTTDPDPSNNVDSVSVTVEPASAPLVDVSISKTATPQPVEAGQLLRFDLRLGNNGPGAGALAVVDELDSNFMLVSASASDGGACTGEQLISCTWANVAAGSEVSAAIDVIALDAGMYSNSATASVTGTGVDPDPSNNIATIAVQVDPALQPPPRADLELVKSVQPNPAMVGDTLVFNLTLTNLGPDNAAASVADTLDTAFELVTASANGGGSCSGQTAVVCNWPELTSGQSVQAELQVIARRDGSVVNLAVANIGAGAIDPNPANNASQVVAQIAPPTLTGEADLAVVKRVIPDEPMVTAPMSFLIEVTNNGPDYAVGPIEIRDLLAAGLQFESAAANGGGICELVGLEVRCSWPGLAAGTTVSASILARASAPGLYRNAIVLVHENVDPNPDNNAPEIEFPVRAPVLTDGAQCRVTEQLTTQSGKSLPGGALRYGGAVAYYDHPASRQVLNDSLLAGTDTAELLPELAEGQRLQLLASSGGGMRSLVRSNESISIAGSDPARLFIVDTRSGAISALPDLTAGTPGTTAVFAADGVHIAFVGGVGFDPAADSTRLAVYDLANGQTTQLAEWAVPPALFDRLVASADLLQFGLQARANLSGGIATDQARVYRYQRDPALLEQLSSDGNTASLGSIDGAGSAIAFVDEGRLLVQKGAVTTPMLVDEARPGIRSPLLGRNGRLVYYLSDSVDGMSLRRANLQGISTVLADFPVGGEPTDVLLDHDGAGQTFLLRSSRALLSASSNDSSELYLIDCDSIRAGAWFNPLRSGHGWDIQRVRDELVSLWFNYRLDGSADWQIANGQRQGRSWQADLLAVEYDYSDGSRALETIGTLAFVFIDSHNALAHWTVNGQSRFERIEFLEFDRRPPRIDHTALWYDPADPGWGVSVSNQGESVYALVYVYDLDGKSLWVDGVSRMGANDVPAQLFRGFGLCPINCPESAPLPTFDHAGQFTLDPQAPGLFPFATQLVEPGRLQWLKVNRPLQTLSDPMP